MKNKIPYVNGLVAIELSHKHKLRPFRLISELLNIITHLQTGVSKKIVGNL